MTLSLDYEPVRDGYTFEPSYPVIEAHLDGGLSEKRLDVLYAPHIVTVNWILERVDYTRFMGFFRTTLKNATQPFLIDLVADIGVPTTHRCRTRGGLPKLMQQRGNAFYVACTLEVQVNPTYTGLITYQEPGNIVFSTTLPSLVGPILEGDTVRIIDSAGTHPTGPTDLDLDGEYVVSGTVGLSVLQLTSPASVNSDWTVLAGLAATAQYGDASNGNVISTITRVPT
jgi:hypothetical protein